LTTFIGWMNPFKRPLTAFIGWMVSSRRPRFQGRLSQNRTSAVHIRLFGTAGCDPRSRPVYDLALSQCQP